MDALDLTVIRYEQKRFATMHILRGKALKNLVEWLAQVLESSLDAEVTWKVGVRTDCDPKEVGGEAMLEALALEWTEGGDETAPKEVQSYATKWRTGKYTPTIH